MTNTTGLHRAAGEDDVIHVVPTIIHSGDLARGTHTVATVEELEKGRALIVFRSEEEAEKYRASTGNHPEAEGWRAAALELEELGRVLEAHGCTHVAMPEEWTGEGAVDFFAAGDFIGMLEGRIPA